MYHATELYLQVRVDLCLVELLTTPEAHTTLMFHADLNPQGENVTRLASMAKLKVGRLGRELSDCCLQFFGATSCAVVVPRRICNSDVAMMWRVTCVIDCSGGNGYMDDNYVARCYRDWRLISIGGGADEVMLSIISKLQQRRLG